MTKRINVSIPDSLAERVEAHRDYLGNLSEIFQRAVDEKITARENFRKRILEDKNMETIVERLKAERMRAKADYREQGRIDGLEWAKVASYTELQQALRKEDEWRDEVYYGGAFTVSNVFPRGRYLGEDPVVDHVWDRMSDDPLMIPQDDDEVLSAQATDWLEGWFEAVREFWNEVQPLLESD